MFAFSRCIKGNTGIHGGPKVQCSGEFGVISIKSISRQSGNHIRIVLHRFFEEVGQSLLFFSISGGLTCVQPVLKCEAGRSSLSDVEQRADHSDAMLYPHF
jgi:hypothetical protein